MKERSENWGGGEGEDEERKGTQKIKEGRMEQIDGSLILQLLNRTRCKRHRMKLSQGGTDQSEYTHSTAEKTVCSLRKNVRSYGFDSVYIAAF